MLHLLADNSLSRTTMRRPSTVEAACMQVVVGSDTFTTTYSPCAVEVHSASRVEPQGCRPMSMQASRGRQGPELAIA